MDLGTIIGIVLGVVSFVLGVAGPNITGLGGFFDFKSVCIVFGGGFASTLMNYKLSDVLSVINIALKTFFEQKQSPTETIKMLVDLSQQSRREGLLALEANQDKIDDMFLRNSLALVIDGVEPDVIRDSMDLELDSMVARHATGAGLFKALAALFPAWGMIGTLIGLVQLLGALSDPSAIGPAMAVALITTLYGSVLANFVCTPLAGKLEIKSKEEVQLKQLVMEGVLSIQAGENPRILEHKLKTFLSPQVKKQYDAQYGEGSKGNKEG